MYNRWATLIAGLVAFLVLLGLTAYWKCCVPAERVRELRRTIRHVPEELNKGIDKAFRATLEEVRTAGDGLTQSAEEDKEYLISVVEKQDKTLSQAQQNADKALQDAKDTMQEAVKRQKG